jgi:hypothetical protein
MNLTPTSFASFVCCAFLTLAVHNPEAADAAIIVVPSPAASIQAAINSATAGDTIQVGPGTYNEKLDLTAKSLILVSTGGAAATTISAGGTGTVIKMVGNGSRVEGFTITGGNASFGGGIEMSFGGVSSVIRNNVFLSNRGTGAAIFGNGTSPLIENNTFKNNTTDFQGLSGVVSFINTSSPRIVNNLFFDNTSRGITLTLPTGSAPQVINNTINGNSVGIRVDRRILTSGQILRNNILTNNGVGLEVEFGSDANNPTFENNLVFGNATDYQLISNQTGLNGNLSSAPNFVDAVLKDFRLLASSPAVDRGSSVGAPTTDFAGNLRPFDGNGDGSAIVDIGAYELVPEPGSAVLSLIGIGVTLWGRRRTRGVSPGGKSACAS